MKKFFPLYLALLAIIFFVGLIARNEEHLKTTQSIFIALKPVDPRSLIQGDYMVLNYELYWDHASLQQDKKINNRSNIQAYVNLDEQSRVIKTSLLTPTTTPLQLRNPSNAVELLYPTTKSFLFAEGLAKCYEQAKYAEFKVNKQGKSILASLRGEDLKNLNCEANKRWIS